MAARDRPAVAALTMARDEGRMLPRWVAHYAAQVGIENLVVLDDNSVDGSTDGLACTVHRIPGFAPGAFARGHMRLMSGIAAGLLATYDAVVYTDVDEFLVADPARYADLPSLLADRPGRDVLASVALNVVHVPGEGALRDGEPVLGQRRFAKFSPIMCKPSLERVAAPWRRSSHGIDAPYEIDPALFMLHLKFADRDELARVADHRQALVEAEGRAAGSNWSRGSEDLVAVLDRAVSTSSPDAVAELDVAALDLASVVQRRDGTYRSVGAGQVAALEQEPLVRIPERLHGLV